MKKTLKYRIFCLFISLYHPLLFANANPSTPEKSLLLTLSGGPAWYQTGQTQTITLAPGFYNTYVANSPTKVLGNGELFLGLQLPMRHHLLGQLGVAGAVDSPIYLSGAVREFSEPQFDNFTYQYHVNYSSFSLKGKLASIWISDLFQPYVSLNLGIAFNKASQFNLIPRQFETIAPPPFQAYQTTSFTYVLGAGIQKTWYKHWQTGIGYTFSDLGKNQLGPSFGEASHASLTLNHLYTSQLQVSLSYFIGESL